LKTRRIRLIREAGKIIRRAPLTTAKIGSASRPNTKTGGRPPNGKGLRKKHKLANTDAFFVKVYSLGQTTVIYEDAATHKDIVIINRKRRVKDNEIEFVVHRLLHTTCDDLDIIYADNFVEISIPKKLNLVFNIYSGVLLYNYRESTKLLGNNGWRFVNDFNRYNKPRASS